MDEQTFRVRILAAAALLYAGLFGYSVLGFGEDVDEPGVTSEQTRAPRVLYHDRGVQVYPRRSVRSSDRRGGGMRGGK